MERASDPPIDAAAVGIDSDARVGAAKGDVVVLARLLPILCDVGVRGRSPGFGENGQFLFDASEAVGEVLVQPMAC